MNGLRRDIGRAFRDIRRAPVFFGTVVLTLAIGIGANTAIFSVVKTVLLDPLPYPEADELVTIHNRGVIAEWSIHPWTPDAVFLEMMRSDSFEEVAGYYPQTFAITGGERPFQLDGALVTPNFFRLFRVGIARGRDFVEADARAGAPPTAIISHEVWQRRFGGSPDVIGRMIQAASTVGYGPGGGLREIIGVLDRGFRLHAPRIGDAGLWVPADVEAVPIGAVITLARLRNGVALRQAQTELDVVSARFEEGYESDFFPGWTRLKAEVVGDDRSTLLILQSAVTVVLLVACVNITNLLLARSSARRREMAVRTALGASRARLLRRSLAESVVLSLLGGTVAVLVMAVALRLLVALVPADVPRIADVSIDAGVLLYTLGVVVAVGLLVGIAPAVVTSRQSPGDVLKEGGRARGGSRKERCIGRALVIGEVALVLVLLAGAGVLARSFLWLTSRDPGFRTQDIVAVPMEVPPNHFESVPEWIDFHDRVLERVRRIPGVESVGLSRNVPLDRGSITSYRTEENPQSADASAQYDYVNPGYFRTLDIPLVRGRYIEATDRAGTRPVVVIDEAMARAAWPGRDPIGERLRFEDLESWRTVVGVVGDIRGSGLAHAPRPGIYIPDRQRVETDIVTRFVLLVRSPAEVSELAGPLRRAIWDVEPRQPIPEITTLEHIVSASVGPYWFRALLFGSFGIIALILAVAGIYGVVERLVAQRTHEFGIRMALGARGRDVLRMVIRQGASLAGIGVTLGLLAAVGLARLLSAALYGVSENPVMQSAFNPQPSRILHGVSATDPPTLAAVAVLLVGVVLIASYVPARRAARVDPMVTLNTE